MEKEEKFSHRHGNVSLVLDSYNDIFSGFDPRHFSERAISIDFLDECKRAVRERNEDELELRLSIPKNKRDEQNEMHIKRRIVNHFQKHFAEKERDEKKLKSRGYKFVIAGIFFMVSAAAVNHYLKESFLITLLTIIFEPAGWFTFWEGLNQLIFETEKKKPELNFYRKMANAHIYFTSY